jgi:voltage-gated potassium channel
MTTVTLETRVVSNSLEREVATVRPYELYMLVLSAVSLAVLAADALWTLSAPTHEVLGYTDTLLCALFFFDFIRSLARATNRRKYFFTTGWLDLVSSFPAIGYLRLGRLSRIARIVRLLRAMRSFRAIGQILSRHRRESVLLVAALVCLLMTIFASLAILQFEQNPDSNIRTAGDAVWWAFATVTTVGYGDLYPVTLEGRLVSAMLMAAGVGLFGTLSGLAASWFLHNEGENESETTLPTLAAEVAALRAAVERLLPRAAEGEL